MNSKTRLLNAIFGITFFLLGAPFPASANYEKGVEAYRARDYARAVQEFQKTVKRSPDHAGSHYMLGLALRGDGQMSRAVTSLRRANELDPSNTSFEIALGQTQVQASQYIDAYLTLKEVRFRDLDARARQSYVPAFATAAIKAGFAGEAISVLEAQTKVNPKDANILYTLGYAYSTEGNSAKAFKAFKKAYELKPSDSKNGTSAVKSAISAGRSAVGSEKDSYYSQGAVIAERLASASETFDNFLLAGEARLGAKDYQKALEWLKLAQEKEPKNPLVDFYLSLALMNQERYDDALDAIDAAFGKGAEDKLAEKLEEQRRFLIGKIEDSAPDQTLPECPGFRETKWGMTKAEVLAIEGTPLETDEDQLLFEGQIAGQDVVFAYNFVEGQLVTGSYLFTKEYTYKNQHIDLYQRFKKLLQEKYGKPAVDSVTWENDLYRDDEGEWGLAVSLGHVSYVASWDTDETEVGIFLGGSNFKVRSGIIYKSKKYAEIANEAKTEEDLSGL